MGGTATALRTPDEVALDLELPLLGTLPSPTPPAARVVPEIPEEGALREAYRRIVDRLLLPPGLSGSVGLLGDVPAGTRALVAGHLGALLAQERGVVLVDADLASGALSFDAGTRAQEGLVDVLRYGVRSPRVVAPTECPGLSLLPVGSGTVDPRGTYSSDALAPLLEELGRDAPIVLVNGPDAADPEASRPLMGAVENWILLHEIGVSRAEATRRIRQEVQGGAGLGVLVLGGGPAPAAPPAEAATPRRVSPAAGVARSATATAPAPSDPAPPPRRAPPSRRSGGGARPWIFAGAAALVALVAFVLLRPEAPVPAPPTRVERVPPPPQQPLEELPLAEPEAAISAEAPPAPVQDVAVSTSEAPPAAVVAEPVAARPAPPDHSAVQGARDLVVPLQPGATHAFVHVSSFRTESQARLEAARFEARGFPTVLEDADVPGQGRWVRVHVGPFADGRAAGEAARRIKSAGVHDYTLVRRLPASAVRDGTGREDR